MRRAVKNQKPSKPSVSIRAQTKKREPGIDASVQTDRDLVIVLACQLFCNEITEALEKDKNRPIRPKIRNEIFADVPEEEIPAILKQAKAIVDNIVWKAKYGVNLLGTVCVNHFTPPTLNNDWIDKYAHKEKRSWHLDFGDMAAKPTFYN